MSDRPSPEQIRQSFFENVTARDITVESITQIVNLGDYPKQTGIPYNIPASSTVRFVGRSQELEHLHQMLQHNDRVMIAAIAGMGGVGKTELATQYALLHLLLLTYPGGICWLRARDEDIGIQVIRFAQTELGLKPPEDLDLPEQVHWCWRCWHERDVLVVLDDVCDYLKVKPYLPPQPSRFKVLITTRLQLDLPQSLTLDVLGEVAALELLRQWIGSEKIDQHLADAKELCHRLGYLPLALNLVGRYVKKRKISLAELLQRLEKKGLQHKALDVDKSDRTWTLDVNRGVTAAFELSWEELSDSAKQLGCLLSLFALAPIPWDLVKSVETGQDAEELEDARVELENLHLLQGDETYQVHPLIQKFLRDKLEGIDRRADEVDRAFPWRHYELKEFDTDELKQEFCRVMVTVSKQIPSAPTPNLIEAIAPAVPHIAEAATSLSAFIKVPDHTFLIEKDSPTRFVDSHPDIKSLDVLAYLLNNLAYLYYAQGRYMEAEPLYERALRTCLEWLGPDHPNTVTISKNLQALRASHNSGS